MPRVRGPTLDDLHELTNKELLILIVFNQQRIMKAQRLDFKMELRQMADFTRLNAKVSGINDIATAVKTMYDGVKTERDAFKVELDALKAADAVDQDAVDTAEANLANAQSTLDAIVAIAAGTPVATDAPPAPAEG